MERENVVRFAELFLKDNQNVDEHHLQRFIFAQPEVAKMLPLLEVRQALEWAYQVGKLCLVYADNLKIILTLPDKS